MVESRCTAGGLAFWDMSFSLEHDFKRVHFGASLSLHFLEHENGVWILHERYENWWLIIMYIFSLLSIGRNDKRKEKKNK